MVEAQQTPFALILSGGLALGAYQAGVCERLLDQADLRLVGVARTSIGAVNGAIIAGNPPDRRCERLRAFWEGCATDFEPTAGYDPFAFGRLPWVRQAHHYGNALAARLGGVPRLFHAAVGLIASNGQPALQDNAEAQRAFADLIDFDRLSSGELRFCIAATDVDTGELVTFDTAGGARFTPSHLRASGGLIPNFPPVQVGGRLLGDGGFTANSLVDAFLASDAPAPRPNLCVLVELFSPRAEPPASVERAVERSTDLQFAGQTQARLAALRRERAVEMELARCDPTRRQDLATDLIHLALPPGDLPQPLKQYDFSRRSLAERYERGRSDAEAALTTIRRLPPARPGLRVHRVGKPEEG